MITWGISGNSHDAAIAVFVCDELKFAAHSERYSGVKNDAHLNKALIAEARSYGDPDKIIWYERPFKKTFRQLFAGQGWNYAENNIRKYLKSYNISAPIRYVDHHHSHAAAGYYTSGFNQSAVICIDSIGEFETLTIWEGNGNNLKKIHSHEYPHSIGLWYSAMTQRLGLKPQEDEYILMGMAAYGDPDRLFDEIKEDFIVNDPLSSFGLTPHLLTDVVTGIPTITEPGPRFARNLHRGCLDWRPDLTTQQDMYDIAAATQKVYEYMFNNVLKWTRDHTNSKNLVIMGGCALNCSANAQAYNYFDRVWIMPNPGDSGSAIGSVLAYNKKHINWPGAYLGHNIEGNYPVEQALQELLTTGICGVASGRAEFGPRALGNRSLLADPRRPGIKDKVNEIKQRQLFRPFAPAVLLEHAHSHFTGHTGPYMQYTSICTDAGLPAITHGDGTSRVQTVSKQQGTGFRTLLERWYEETGCPVLLNTSLNIKGKPIVNTIQDAQEFARHYGVAVFT